MKNKWITLMDGDDLIKARKAGDTGYWWVLQSTDLAPCCGEEEAAKISGNKKMLIQGELSLVPGKALCSDEQHKSVLETYSWDDFSEFANDRDSERLFRASVKAGSPISYFDVAPDTEEAWIEMAHGYGLRVVVESAFGSTNEIALKKTLKKASFLVLDGPVDYLLNKPVNRIGQTGLEHLAGNMTACFERAACHESASDEQRLVAKISSPQMRTVKQQNMSSECMMVQVWGLEHCKTCEYRTSSECGGKHIRQTGKNEKGLEVPVS